MASSEITLSFDSSVTKHFDISVLLAIVSINPDTHGRGGGRRVEIPKNTNVQRSSIERANATVGQRVTRDFGIRLSVWDKRDTPRSGKPKVARPPYRCRARDTFRGLLNFQDGGRGLDARGPIRAGERQCRGHEASENLAARGRREGGGGFIRRIDV